MDFPENIQFSQFEYSDLIFFIAKSICESYANLEFIWEIVL